MGPTRRKVAILAAAAAFSPRLAWPETREPIIIADGGAIGSGPLYTRESFERAIVEGADFLAAELVATQDGALVAHPGRELTLTTDVADIPDFLARRTTKPGGAEGWFTENFTLAELKTLAYRDPSARGVRARAGEPKPTILTLREVIAVARAGSIQTARVIGVYPTMRDPAYFASIGLALEGRLAEAVHAEGYDSPAAAMWVSCAEAASLKAFGSLSRVRRAQRMGAGAVPTNVDSADGIAQIQNWAQAIGPEEELALDHPSLSTDAHASGLAVHAWASRSPRKPDDTRKALTRLMIGGADGVAANQPSLAVRARAEALRAIERMRPLAMRAQAASPPN